MAKHKARQAADDNITRPMHFACWITQSTNTYPEYVILIALQSNNDYANAPQFYILRTLPVLQIHIFFCSSFQSNLIRNSWVFFVFLTSFTARRCCIYLCARCCKFPVTTLSPQIATPTGLEHRHFCRHCAFWQ